MRVGARGRRFLPYRIHPERPLLRAHRIWRVHTEILILIKFAFLLPSRVMCECRESRRVPRARRLIYVSRDSQKQTNKNECTNQICFSLHIHFILNQIVSSIYCVFSEHVNTITNYERPIRARTTQHARQNCMIFFNIEMLK